MRAKAASLAMQTAMLAAVLKIRTGTVGEMPHARARVAATLATA